ncbi:lipoate--protein ligase [Faecalicatena sp. AGMB00832]|uniref:lipoate--protein ligase n=1 Tax=Faecalicatena faecalis TaxID=2726362 RepID=A0ABS6D3T5_9FIRM|nr:lipoate--protein ligase [Faecalicatena faecalis]
MIRKITYIESKQYDPYENLAVEEYLLLNCREDQCILYLWQNQNTVVIGRNQNAWKECLVSKLEEDGGHLARRLSGGGAVYHDLGNLNFTFLAGKENYNVDRQLEVILKAVSRLGIQAEKSGRNDVLIHGKKFSGNAFYEQGAHCCHHGTLMVNVNLGELSKYLTVSKEKLQSKGVDSVKSRVANLTEFLPELSIEQLKLALKYAFDEVYGLQAEVIGIEDLEQDKVQAAKKRFSSWKWLYGRKIDFQYELSHRFSWGQMNIQLKVADGRIEDVAVYSDSLVPGFIENIPKYLKKVRYNKNSICAELGLYWSRNQQEEEMIKDIIAWIKTVDL